MMVFPLQILGPWGQGPKMGPLKRRLEQEGPSDDPIMATLT
jgi:hypothetical protein